MKNLRLPAIADNKAYRSLLRQRASLLRRLAEVRQEDGDPSHYDRAYQAVCEALAAVIDAHSMHNVATSHRYRKPRQMRIEREKEGKDTVS